ESRSVTRQQPPDIGQGGTVSRAFEHAHAERPLQHGDAVGERGLRHALRRRGTRVRAVLGDAAQFDQALGVEPRQVFNNPRLCQTSYFILDIMDRRASISSATTNTRREAHVGRNVHLVGSVPMANAQEVFKTVSAALGPRLRRLPDGETGERSDWITWLEPAFADNPAFEKSGEVFRVHASGTGGGRYTLKSGFAPQDVRFDNLFYADIAKNSYAVFKRLKDAGSIPAGAKFQVDLVPAHSVIWLFLVDKLHAPIDPIYN